ncbi:hypothetical protein D3C73_1520500 [compost metagenome]
MAINGMTKSVSPIRNRNIYVNALETEPCPDSEMTEKAKMMMPYSSYFNVAFIVFERLDFFLAIHAPPTVKIIPYQGRCGTSPSASSEKCRLKLQHAARSIRRI